VVRASLLKTIFTAHLMSRLLLFHCYSKLTQGIEIPRGTKMPGVRTYVGEQRSTSAPNVHNIVNGDDPAFRVTSILSSDDC